MATLIFAGLRISEACQIERRDVDLANGRINVRRSKTDAGLRDVDLLPVLRDVPLNCSDSDDGRGWFRTSDLSRVKAVAPQARMGVEI